MAAEQPRLAAADNQPYCFVLVGAGWRAQFFFRLGEAWIWIYRTPFPGARLADEELAMANVLARMGAYVRGDGPEPYPLREAMQDHYLGLLIRQACESGDPQVATQQTWARPE